MGATVLVNYWECENVGHTIEALRYCLGYHRSDPSLRVSVLLNGAAPTELAQLCPFIGSTYPVGSPAALRRVPPEWDYVMDNPRRYSIDHVTANPEVAAYFTLSDQYFHARRTHGVIGCAPPDYAPHQQLLLDLPAAHRRHALRVLAGASPRIAVLPAGSGSRWLYPSASSWEIILRELTRRYPDAVVCLMGKLGADERTRTTMAAAEVERLRLACPRAIDCLDIGLSSQLAIVEACDLLLSPHSGFGMAALAVGTPWLTISGGRWPEYFFNGSPFYSVLPDLDRYSCYTQFAPAAMLDTDEDGEGPRTPSMSRARVLDDLGELLTAADGLIHRRWTYEECLARHFERVLRLQRGDRFKIWTFDGAHLAFVGPQQAVPTLAEIEVSDDLLDPQIVADPYPYLHMLRAADPVHWNARLRSWVLTRHADVAVGLSGEYLAPRDHQHPRDVAGHASASGLAQTVRARLQRAVSQLLDALTGRGGMDLVVDLAAPLPALVNAELLGAAPEDRDRFEALSALQTRLQKTATDLIANGALALLRNPCQLKRLRAGEVPIGPSIEELVRYDGPFKAVLAIAQANHDLDGRMLRTGDRVLLFRAAANRDPTRFADPDRLDLARTHNPHVGFGHGGQHCPDADLARVEAEVVLTALLDRFPRLRLAGEPVWQRTLLRRRLRTLPVTF